MINKVQKVQTQQTEKTDSKETSKPVQHNKVQVNDIFTAALLTAKDKKLKDVNNIMKQFDKDGNGKLDEKEQLEYIKAVKKSNHKTISKDKYDGPTKEGKYKNSDIEKKAFNTLANGTYNWYGKKGDHQQKERTEQINNGSRDVQKSVRVMLDKLNIDDIIIEQEKAKPEAEKAPKKPPLTETPKSDLAPKPKLPETEKAPLQAPKSPVNPMPMVPIKPPEPGEPMNCLPDVYFSQTFDTPFKGTKITSTFDNDLDKFKINIVEEFNKPKNSGFTLGNLGSAAELLEPKEKTLTDYLKDKF